MAYQAGMDISAALKLETTFGVKPAVVTGADQWRITGGGGLRLAQALIDDPTIRNDGERDVPDLGSRSVTGSYISPLSYGGVHDIGMEAALRGTWAVDTPTAGTDRLVPGVPKVERSFTTEEYEQGIDGTSVFKGCRFAGFTWRLTPNSKVLIEYPMVGADMELLSGASAPLYTSPTLTTTRPMSSPAAAISVDGVAVVEFTSAEVRVDNGAAGVDLVGTNVTPNIWTDNLRVTGSITALRSSLARQQKYLDGVNFALAIAATDKDGNQYILNVPLGLFTDYTKNLGAAGPLLVTMPFTAGVDVGGTVPNSVYVDRIAA